jgi:tetratricopeptide (TPR) repeat protein
MGDPRRATFLLERALDLLPEGAPGRAGVMVELAAAGWNVLGLDRVRALLADGLALAVEHGERAVELRARLLQFGVRSETGPDYIPEREVLTQTEVLLEELEGLDAPRAVATALCTRAESEWWLGQAGAAVASVRRAVEVLNEIGDDTVWALVILARTLVDAPMAASAGERLLTGLLAELGGRPAVRSELVRGQAMMALLRGRAAEAWKLFDAAREIDRDLGRAVEARVADLRRRLLLCEGRYEEALPELVSAVRRYDDAGYLPNAAEARSWLAFCEARLGNLAAAAVAARTTLEWMDPDDMYEPAARAHIALSEIAAATGDANGTVESAQSAVLAAEAGDWIILNAEARLTLAKALALSGDPVGAETHARAALDMHRAKEYAFGAAEAERFLRSLVVASA